MKCILNVSEREYDKILQLNHDAVVWKTTDQHLMHGLEQLIGSNIVAAMGSFDECKMQKQDGPEGHARLEPDEGIQSADHGDLCKA